jgi:allophanate hydrolase
LYTNKRTKMNPNAARLTLADWQAAYAQGAAVARTVPEHARQVFAHSPPQAWILQLPLQQILARCEALDALAAGYDSPAQVLQALPLFGVPFVVKDNIDVGGWPTTAACTARRDATARESATVVQRLLLAGAVLLGKTNLDQFATGLVGTRSPYGAPASALAPERISGGSSSGSAVLVAGGHVPFSLGTDTAGSGRVPAGFNQIVGLKPTPGRVSTAGVLPACRSLDCVSVFALTVEDAATVLAVIEGPDPADAYGHFQPGPADMALAPRIGVPADVRLDASLGYPGAWTQALQTATGQLGATPVALDFGPLHAVARMLYEGPWVVERTHAMQALLQHEPEALDPAVAAVVARAATVSALDTFRAQYALQEARAALASLWQQVDLLMVPTAPTHPDFAQVRADPLGVNAALGTYTNFVNLLGWSALAVPAGSTAGGLPFGVTFIGPAQADAALAAWGRRWAQALDLPLGATGQRRPAAAPCREPATEPALPIAVVGAHLSGLPLNGQLLERGARLLRATTTAAQYRLFALPGTRPPKPGLLRVGAGGHAIAVEVWSVPLQAVGSFLALIPPPLGLGSVELAEGGHVHGFLCEPLALEGATDISHHGGWRAYLASL